MDFLKEAYEAWSQRVKTPLVGSMIIAFFAWNWKPIWYLFASDESAAIRLRFFELNTDAQSLFVGPAIAGTTLALVIPWLAFGGAFFTFTPVAHLKKLQQKMITDQRVFRDEEAGREAEAKERLRDQRAESALRISQQAKQAEAMGDEELAASIKADDIDIFDPETTARNLTEMEVRVLTVLKESPDSAARLEYYEKGTRIDSFSQLGFTERREYLEAEKALRRLASAGLVATDGIRVYRLTLKGFEVADFLAA